MPVTDEQMVFLRAYLARQAEIAERVIRQLDGLSDGADGIPQLVYATFVLAAWWKFSPTWTRADVIRFVAQVRALLREGPDVLDPLAAEHQLRSALGEELGGYPDKEASARAQIILLDALVQSANLDDAGLDELLAQGRRLTERMSQGW